jgi:uncharacterized protein CbrC (UPF0167 family)
VARSATFDELGIPFPLFKGPVDEASEYRGEGRCSICHQNGHVFELGIGAEVVVECGKCKKQTVVDADDRSTPCHLCEHTNSVSLGDEAFACYRCLRDGRAALTTDTELGMICWADAERGSTHGLPDGDPNGEWRRRPVDPARMRELLSTPNYTTWQGEGWLFDGDCNPMPYLGCYGRKEFAESRSDRDAKAAFLAAIGPDSEAEQLWEGVGPDSSRTLVCVYVFADPSGSLRAHYDFS